MNHDPMVAIIGRPNVGKSSLFNKLIKERISIEEPTEGVTRDRLIYPLRISDKNIQLIDTGGIGIVDRQSLEDDVNEQIDFALASADYIIFVLDGQNEIAELDRAVAKRIHISKVPVLCVANKIDNETFENETSKFLALGFGEVIAISCIHNFGFPDLQRGIGSLLKDVAKKNKKKKRESLRLAFAGRRNVGKSSLTNLLCGEKRVIVSNEAGTTRDAVDVEVDYNGMALTLIDTAGLRKKNQTEDSIEFFSVNRTFGALYRADVGILMLDAEQGISQVDQKLGRWFSDHHKLCVIVVNKWDLAKGKTTHAEYDTYVHDRLPGLGYVPIIYISVLEDLGVNVLFDTIQTLLEQVKSEHTTHQLNEILKLAQMRKKPRLVHGSVPKLFYISALKQMPPTYLIFGKSTERIMDNYKRYLHQFLRKSLKKEMLPIQLVFKNRKSLFKDTE